MKIRLVHPGRLVLVFLFFLFQLIAAELSAQTTVIFSDDFNTGTIDGNKWRRGTNAGNQSSVISHQLELRSQGSENGWILTRNKYKAQNTTVSVKVVQPGDDGDIGMSPNYSMSNKRGIYNQKNWYRFYTSRPSHTGPYRLIVQWKKNNVLGGNLDVTGNLVITSQSGVYLRLRFNNTNIYFDASFDGVNWVNTYTEVFSLPGYTLNTSFYYELAAYNTTSNGVMTADDFAIRTLDTQSPTISSVAASNLTASTAMISWTTNEAADSQVEYGLTTSYGSVTTLNPSLVTSHAVALVGLQANTLYHYRVKSRDAAGNFATSGDFTFTTLSNDVTPPIISNVAANNITISAATISWATNEAADSQVEYGLTTSYGSVTTLDPALVTSHSVVFAGLQSNALYHYRVKSKDAAGNLATSGDFTFSTDVTAPIISNVAANNITISAATISWATNEAADSQVEYGLTTSYGSVTTLDPALVTSHSVVLAGLQSNALYHYRVKSKDAAGNLATSGDFTFSTLSSDVTPPIISNVVASNITISAATISWATNETSDSQVEYGLTTSYGSVTALNPSPVTSHSVLLSGLQSNTFYHYRVKSKDAAGNLATSGDFTFSTDVTAPIISNVAANNITISAATISWATNEAADSQVEYGLTTSYGSVTTLDPALVTAHSVALAGLQANALYHYRVKSKDAAGNLATSGDFTFTTLSNDVTPPIISNVVASNITISAATITWTTNEAADSQVEYGLTTSYGSVTTFDPALVLSHSVALAGLQANTLYHYRVKSKDAAGNLATSGDFTFSTDVTPPIISNVAASNITISAATISWATNEGADSQVEYGLTTSYGSVTTLDPALVTSHSVVLAGLQSNALYHYRVKSKDAAGNLATSGDFTFTMLSSDVTPPTISNVVASNITISAATISWATNEASDSQVEYGLTTGYGSVTTLDPALVTLHSVALAGLQANALYHYRVKSKDAAGNLATSNDFTFNTANASAQFVDITANAGVAGIPEHGGHAIIFADVNGDERMDMYVTHTNFAPSESPYHFFDFDLRNQVATFLVLQDELFINNGNNTFTETAAAADVSDPGESHGAVFVDIDNDGDFDLFNGQRGPSGNRLYKNNGNGTFTEVTASAGILPADRRTIGVMALDIDNDGDMDLFSSNWGVGNEMYVNDGTGHFTVENRGVTDIDPDPNGKMSATAADVDNDGDMDIFVGKRIDVAGDASKLYINNGSGYFTDQAAGRGVAYTGHANGAVFVDLDWDGDLDMLLAVTGVDRANPIIKLGVYRNQGNGTFVDETNVHNIPYDGFTLNAGDLDNDGDVDIFTYINSGTGQIWLNNGTGHFAQQTNAGFSHVANDARAGTLADIDNDGDLDIAFTEINQPTSLYRNDLITGTGAQNYLQIKLTGANGRVGLFGSKFYLYEAGHLAEPAFLRGYQQFTSVVGTLSQNFPIAHFGVSPTKTYDLRVRLLDGNSITRTNLTPGQRLNLQTPPDTQPPVIASVAVSGLTSSAATITWTTNEVADSQVEYGLTTSYGSSSTLDAARVTSHSVVLANLSANMLYHYRVKSRDAAGNLATSGDFTFTTLAPGATVFSDNFNTGTLDLNKWRKGTNAGNQSSVNSNQLRLQSQGVESGWVITKNAYAARQTIVQVKVVQPNGDGDLGMTPTYTLSSPNGIFDETNWYRFYTYRSGGAGPYRLLAQWKKNGVESNVDVTGNLTITGAIYLRLRCDNTSIHFEASFDGATWTDAYSESFGLPGYTPDSPFYYELSGYNTNSNGVLIVDDFSITTPATNAIMLYTPFEIQLATTTSYSNPYLDMSVTGVFTSPSGRVLRLKGFWDGVQNWIVRFAPDESGVWSYQTQSADAALVQSGTFAAAANPAKRGFVRVSPARPDQFEYSDGTPCLLMGDTNWEAMSSGVGYVARFKPYIDLRSSQNFNAYHSIVVHSRYDYQSNEGGAPFAMFDPDNRNFDALNPDFFKWVDRRVAYADSMGVTSILFFSWAYEIAKMSTPQYDRIAQYIVARYAAYNVFWVLAGDYHSSTVTSATYRQIGQAVANADPYDHPLTIHPSDSFSNRDFANDAWMSYVMHQMRDAGEFIADSIRVDRIYNKPVVNGEYGYHQPFTVFPNHGIRSNANYTRTGGWSLFGAGGYFIAGFLHTFLDPDSHYPYNPDFDVLPTYWDLNDPLDLEAARQYSVFSQFFRNNTAWQNLAPHPEWVLDNQTELLATPGVEYVAYHARGGRMRLQLPAGYFSLAWFDPIVGVLQAARIFESTGETVLLTPADTLDAAALLRPASAPTLANQGNVTNLQSAQLNIKQVRFTWQTPVAADSRIDLQKPNGSRIQFVDIRETTAHDLIVDGLSANVNYTVTVSSQTADGRQWKNASQNLVTAVVVMDDWREAEAMPTKTVGHAEPPGWNLNANGYIATTLNFPQTGFYTLTIRGRGECRQRLWPNLVLELDGTQLMSRAINSAIYREFIFAGQISAGSREVKISFTNAGNDRQLIVDRLHVQFNGNTDTQPPIISGVAANNISNSSATINWNTNEASDSQVEYGLTTSYGASTSLSVTLVTSHSASLSGLNANTTYHYRVKSRDAAGNLATSGDFTFATSSTLPPFEVTLEAENMPIKTNGAARPPGWALWENGYLAQTVNFPGSGLHQFTLRAMGNLVAGEWSQAELRIDQAAQAVITVSASVYTEFAVSFTVAAGAHEVTIAFINDLYDPPANRNLYVDWLRIQNGGAGGSVVKSRLAAPVALPENFALQSFPNPFNAATRIRFALPQAAEIEIKIFDMAGHELLEPASGERSAGNHEAIWNGRDRNGKELSSGVYLVRLRYRTDKTGAWSQLIKRVMMVK